MREADAVFTGIVQQLGQVVSATPVDSGVRLMIDPAGWKHEPSLGDSIAVNGCCLTVAGEVLADRMNPPRGRGGSLAFDVILQTLAVTTLGALKPGDSVNLEHAVTPQTLLGGHIVQGHIDGVGEVASVQPGGEGGEHRVRIRPPVDLMNCIVQKGSIAVDGVSLTIAAIGPEWFEVALIPTTLELTTLGRLRQGSRVNLEADYLAKVVVNYLRNTRHSRESGNPLR